jgi:anti-anti-sigma factor
MTGDVPSDHAPAAPGMPYDPGGREAHTGSPPVLDQVFDADSLYALRAAVEAHAAEAGMREGRRGDLVIAVHELAANAVRHGAGTGRLRMWRLEGVLRCRVTDGGVSEPDRPVGAGRVTGPVPQDLAAVWPVEHGRGLWMVRQLADQFSLSSGPGGTLVDVAFAVPASRPSFRLTQHIRDGQTVLELAGDLDQGSAPELIAVIDVLAAAGRARQLVLDLAAMVSWDSIGIAALITAQRRVNGSPAVTMVLTGMSDDFRQRLYAIDITRQFTLGNATG